MPDLQETIKSIKEWIDDPFADDFPLGIMQNALELLEKQDKIIEQYKKADAFLLKERKMSKSDASPPWFWQRKDLYRNENGQCWYLDMCGKVECDNDPSGCEQFDNFFDGECLADEILSSEDV